MRKLRACAITVSGVPNIEIILSWDLAGCCVLTWIPPAACATPRARDHPMETTHAHTVTVKYFTHYTDE